MNAVLLGGLAACYAATDTTMLLYAASLLPHGIFELPALILAFSMGLYICGHLTRRCRRDPAALPLGACLGLAARLLVFLLLPLLILAALTEAYVTPLAAALDRQLTAANCNQRRELPFHKMLLNGQLPQSIGGGIGQSRLCMLLIGTCHIGEVQVSLWDADTMKTCEDAGITLL